MSTAVAHNFHVPLSAGVYGRLKYEAKRQQKPATQLVKQIVEYWLEEQEKLVLHEEIARYAAESAGTNADLDEQFEIVSIECLNDAENLPWSEVRFIGLCFRPVLVQSRADTDRLLFFRMMDSMRRQLGAPL